MGVSEQQRTLHRCMGVSLHMMGISLHMMGLSELAWPGSSLDRSVGSECGIDGAGVQEPEINNPPEADSDKTSTSNKRPSSFPRLPAAGRPDVRSYGELLRRASQLSTEADLYKELTRNELRSILKANLVSYHKVRTR